MADDVLVRRAVADDAEAIQRVARASWHEAYDQVLGADVVTETVESWFDPETLVADDVEDEDRPLFVAVVDDTVVGFAETVPDGDDDRTAHLYRIYVSPDHWGRGIGSSLLERVETELESRGFERLRLSVMAANDVGVQFYESRGFQRVSTTHDDQFDVQRYEYRKAL